MLLPNGLKDIYVFGHCLSSSKRALPVYPATQHPRQALNAGALLICVWWTVCLVSGTGDELWKNKSLSFWRGVGAASLEGCPRRPRPGPTCVHSSQGWNPCGMWFQDPVQNSTLSTEQIRLDSLPRLNHCSSSPGVNMIKPTWLRKKDRRRNGKWGKKKSQNGWQIPTVHTVRYAQVITFHFSTKDQAEQGLTDGECLCWQTFEMWAQIQCQGVHPFAQWQHSLSVETGGREERQRVTCLASPHSVSVKKKSYAERWFS